MARARENLVDGVTEALVLRILGGELAPGTRLPSVRALAAAHGVNVSTVQRVLVRLEEMRVVEARPRSGVVVLDPQRHGGSALWPVILEHAATRPALACAVLRDALAARRALSVDVASGLLQVSRLGHARAIEASIAAFARTVEASPADFRAIAAAEHEIVRTVLIAAERPAVLAIYNDITAMLLADETVLAALCGDAGQVVAAWQTFAQVLERGSAREHAAYVEPLLRGQDERIVARYAAALAAREPARPETRPQRPRRKP